MTPADDVQERGLVKLVLSHVADLVRASIAYPKRAIGAERDATRRAARFELRKLRIDARFGHPADGGRITVEKRESFRKPQVTVRTRYQVAQDT